MTDPTNQPSTGQPSTDPARTPATFRILIVPGVNPDRWLRVWAERLRDVPAELVVAEPADAEARLRAGDADAALVRLPVDRDGLGVIPLYDEATVVVVPKDHVLTVVEEVPVADLADEVVVVPGDDLLGWSDAPGTPFSGGDVPTTADAIDLVAAGVGVVLLPQSVGRLHQRRGLTARLVPEAPGSTVALVWVEDRYDDLTEEFIGIVRGRKANSSRGRGAAPEEPPSKKSGTESGRSPRAKASSGAGSGKRGAAKGKSSGGGAAASRTSGRSTTRRPRKGR
ncbi:LysR family substrate-binding domain-containing protein [Cellulomonas sp. JH27-2]|uniref:LysR family substrate-binding domain-containing protein n=1 Tax=Cellulomonas sp. JH27-2 TaxID=2774139 RepID=UPI0017859361|nr:LysR family substrate-binding domain-containing protein [Cellulomonas sp. JH27-2]MBD8059288.1 LysR family substrate-binding domain-containing protein [Cellulomonas sp. JH27-2]